MIAKNTTAPKTVLVFQIGSLGDTIVSIPAYRAVRRHFGPEARILILHNKPRDVRAMPYQVLDGSGLVDGSITFQQYGGRATFKTWLEMYRKIRAVKPDAVAYLSPGERTAKQTQRDKLFFRFCGIRQCVGFYACDLNLFKKKDAAGHPADAPHESKLRIERLERDGVAPDRDHDFAQPLFVVPEDVMQKTRQWVAEQLGSRQGAAGLPVGGSSRADRPLVAICPGANAPSKLWPFERFEEIGKRLIAMDDVVPLVVGGPMEREIGDRLIKSWNAGINAAGLFSVSESAGLLSQCRLLIGLDTGTTHLSAAVGTPCVVMHADRNPPGQWEPLGDGHQILRHYVPCAGCASINCPVAGHPCMTNISVERVWQAVQKAYRGAARGKADELIRA
jgi:ADP-heptose:LPS heptosyltransferase